MDYLFQDGGKPKVKKSKTGTGTKAKSKTGSKTKSKTGSKTKSSSKTSTKTTKSKTPKKGGNFLGSIGELVAPTGWGSFATAAALVGIDQASTALRRGKSEKSSAKKGGAPGNNKSLKPNSVATVYHMGNQNIPRSERMRTYWQTPEGIQHAEFIRKKEEAENIKRKKNEENAAERTKESDVRAAILIAERRAAENKSVENYVAEYKIQKKIGNPNSQIDLARALRFFKTLDNNKITNIIAQANKS